MVTTAPLLVADWKNTTLSFCSPYLQEVESVSSTSQVFDPHNVPAISLTGNFYALWPWFSFSQIQPTQSYWVRFSSTCEEETWSDDRDTEVAWETASVSAISQEEFGQRESSWISCFSIAVIKHHAQGKQTKGFIWAYGFTGIRVHYGRKWEAWCQEQKSETSPLKPQAWSKENEGEIAQVSKLSKPASSNVFSSSKPYLLNRSIQQHQLGTKCSNAQDDGGGRLLFKSP